jgi:hypothetical protein
MDAANRGSQENHKGDLIMAAIRAATGPVRTATEGGVVAAAVVVAADLASTQWPETQGAGVLAGAVVGAVATWGASVARNLSLNPKFPDVLRTVLGAKV